MLRSLCTKFPLKPTHRSYVLQRQMHGRNKKAKELITTGCGALKEVDRVIDYCERDDHRLIPQLRTAKENFELALEADPLNRHARNWLAKLHLKYHVPGKCPAVGAALLVEAANMGDPEAQYELACHLRVGHENFSSDQQAFHYLEKAVDQGHVGATIAYGSVLLRVPERLTKYYGKGPVARKTKSDGIDTMNPMEMARKHFVIAAKGGCNLGFKWLSRLEEEEKRLHQNDTQKTTAHSVYVFRSAVA